MGTLGGRRAPAPDGARARRGTGGPPRDRQAAAVVRGAGRFDPEGGHGQWANAKASLKGGTVAEVGILPHRQAEPECPRLAARTTRRTMPSCGWRHRRDDLNPPNWIAITDTAPAARTLHGRRRPRRTRLLLRRMVGGREQGPVPTPSSAKQYASFDQVPPKWRILRTGSARKPTRRSWTTIGGGPSASPRTPAGGPRTRRPHTI